jgi:hypothetical protein
MINSIVVQTPLVGQIDHCVLVWQKMEQKGKNNVSLQANFFNELVDFKTERRLEMAA